MRLRTLLALCLALAPLVALGQIGGKGPYQRAEPPKPKPGEFDGVFFNDVFTEALQGERPDAIGRPVRPAPPPGGGQPTPTEGGEPAGGVFAWSKIISPTTVADEVKKLKLKVDQNVTTPSKFAGRDYKLCRRDFTMLAMLFGVAAEYDGDVRFKDTAAVARDLFARSAANCKVGSTQAYNEAKIRKTDLQDLVNGSRLNASGDPSATAEWGKVVDRSPLMQRLETALQAVVQPATSNKNEFNSNSEDLLHEAELIAAIGEVLTKDGMADADDSDYTGFADRMKNASREIVEAVKLDNYDKASSAVGEIRKSCSECHELYRG